MKVIIIFIALSLFMNCTKKQKRLYASDVDKLASDEDTIWNAAIRRYSMAFNPYRAKNYLPILPGGFYLSKSGRDYFEWKNPNQKLPCFDIKIITWFGLDRESTSLIWENNIFRSKKGELLSFRYIRRESDSLVLNYADLNPQYRQETDSLYLRSYRYFDERGNRKMLIKMQYDSVLESWDIKF